MLKSIRKIFFFIIYYKNNEDSWCVVIALSPVYEHLYLMNIITLEELAKLALTLDTVRPRHHDNQLTGRPVTAGQSQSRGDVIYRPKPMFSSYKYFMIIVTARIMLLITVVKQMGWG